jgi:hypothetical protein
MMTNEEIKTGLWCRDFPKLDDWASIGQGLFYKGKSDLPSDAVSPSFSRCRSGFRHIRSRPSPPLSAH